MAHLDDLNATKIIDLFLEYKTKTKSQLFLIMFIDKRRNDSFNTISNKDSSFINFTIRYHNY
jgi:hypothetical protein